MSPSGLVGVSGHDDGPVVELRGIRKVFPGVVANDDVDLELNAGECLALLGENGAGKSTLMNILSGMYQPDAGTIRVRGGAVSIDSPRTALDFGIGTVYQHSTLVPTLSVLENLMLGTNEGVRLGVEAARARLAELAGMLGVDIDPDSLTETLSLGEQQQIEVIKALWRGGQVLVLDEPTSMLAPQGVRELTSVLARLKQHGLAVVFITHKLHEALTIGDRVVILKQGRVIGAIDAAMLASTPHAELTRRIVEMMFGGEAAALANVAELRDSAKTKAAREFSEDPVFELVGATVKGSRGETGIHDVSLAVRPGEILGVAGVDGNGQRELAEAIAGHRPLTAGDVRLLGTSVKKLSVSQRQRLGLRYVTDDRIGEGIISPFSVALNLVLKRIGQAPFWRAGRVHEATVNETGRRLIGEFDIRTPSETTRIGNLSGGNIQKSVLARELSFDPRIVVYNKPTYGLDVRTTQAVRRRIREQAALGVAAVLISTELEETLALADRIAVLYRGGVTGIVENGPGAERKVGELMVGVTTP